MSTIAELGDKILGYQTGLGLQNPKYYRPGLVANPDERQRPLFQELAVRSELHELFAWHNGVATEGIPMANLCIKPRFYLLSAEESVLSNKYCSAHLHDWSCRWYPLLTDSAAELYFCDSAKQTHERLPVYNFDPEGLPNVTRIYDSIRLMFETILECYVQGAFYVNQAGLLKGDLRREADIARTINKDSEFWYRGDLF